MYDDNQVDIPESFLMLYRVAGRLKLTATREIIGARYDLCEDLASHLVEYARARHHDLGISEDDVLVRCHQGLQSEAAGVNPDEAVWVIRRLAELQGWICPALDGGASDAASRSGPVNRP